MTTAMRRASTVVSIPKTALSRQSSKQSLKDSLKVNLPHALTLKPINTEDGIALFSSVTVGDAISDLPRFDW